MARAKAAKVSIIKFTQSICTGVSGDYFRTAAPMKAIKMATKFTVS